MTSNLAIGSKRLGTLTLTTHLPLEEIKSIKMDIITFEVVTEVQDKALTSNQYMNSVEKIGRVVQRCYHRFDVSF